MNESKVSIIVAVYNVEQYIRRSLDSIQAQIYQNFEAILVDDGSPDNGGAICDEYAAKDSRFHVIHQVNQGVSVARQVGLDAATGEYVIHIDPDDYVDDNMLEELVDMALKSNADIVTCNFFLNDEKEIVRSYKGHDDLLRKFLEQEIEFSLWNTLISRKFVIAHHVSFQPLWLCHNEDHLFIIRCLVAGAKPVHLNKAFYHYITRGDSLVTTRSKKSLASIIAYIDELEKMVDAKEYDNLFSLKRFVYIYAYESRWFKDMKRLFPDIRPRLAAGANANRYSIESQLARCMKYPPLLVWLEAKAHLYMRKILRLKI